MKKMHHSHKSFLLYIYIYNKHDIVFGWDYRFCGLVETYLQSTTLRWSKVKMSKYLLRCEHFMNLEVFGGDGWFQFLHVDGDIGKWLFIFEQDPKEIRAVDIYVFDGIQSKWPKPSTFMVSVSHYPRKVLNSPEYYCYYGSEDVISSKFDHIGSSPHQLCWLLYLLK